jgi:hypothetical protein
VDPDATDDDQPANDLEALSGVDAPALAVPPSMPSDGGVTAKQTGNDAAAPVAPGDTTSTAEETLEVSVIVAPSTAATADAAQQGPHQMSAEGTTAATAGAAALDASSAAAVAAMATFSALSYITSTADVGSDAGAVSSGGIGTAARHPATRVQLWGVVAREAGGDAWAPVN